MKDLNQFTNLYQVSKTLRFELIPIGRTKENIEKNGILARDEQRAEDYTKVKGFIDEYHKQFIQDRLWTFKLPLNSEGNHDSLEEYQLYYELSKRDDVQEAAFKEVKDNLRGIIAKRLTSGSAYERIFKKELIREDLIDFLEDEGSKELVRQFTDFTTYFSGFHENRKNMYAAEEKSTAIAYRLIHQNLPKFMDNMKAFAKIAETSVAEHFADIYEGWKEHLNVASIEEIFRLDYFSETLTQRHIEVYNYIIGKKILEDGTEIKGINEYVNLYNQQQKDKSMRLPFLVPLYKQILSDREKLSWLAEEFDSDEKTLSAINESYNHLHDLLMGEENESLRSLLSHIKDFNLNHINISNDLSLTDISQHLFSRYDVFTNGIKDELRAITPRKKKESDDEFEDRITKIFKSQKSFSIALLDKLPQPVMDNGKTRSVEEYFMSLGAIHTETIQKENLFVQIENAYEDARTILQMKDTGDTLSQNKPAVTKIKVLLDALKDLQHFIKPLLGSGEENEKDELFYGSFQMMWDELDTITPLYNKVRNWLTRKPYSTEKIKLNFDSPTLLKNMAVPQTSSAAIFRDKSGYYYLGILDSNCRNCLNNLPSDAEITTEGIEYMNYRQGGDMGKNVQNLMVINGVTRKVNGRKETSGEFVGQNLRLEDSKNKYLPAHINAIRKKQSYLKTSSTFNKEDLATFIEYYIPLVKEYYSDFVFHFKAPHEYASLPDFTEHINAQAYQLFFTPISKKHIDQLVNDGKMFLFRIWNKDFSEYSKGTPNLHTLYWKMLFDERNLTDVVYMLNGQGAEIFYRKASIKPESRIIHPAQRAIANKNELNKKRTSTFEYDIIKDRRYTVDKFQFHVPITIGFKAVGQTNINPVVQDTIRRGGFTHIIGIDRGERHLLYLSLIDLKGNIVKQKTLNDIINDYKGVTYKTNYHDLLVKREGDRTEARRSWDTIENIKELKEGYLSQVVHVIAKMMVEYNAIIILEDLNTGFMRGRQKIERQVYEKFEKMLIEKLNCYIDKQANPSDIGGLLHPLQLTCDALKWKRSRQCGCLFYIPAWNTSKIDPVTGFVNLFDTRYDTREKARLFFSKFQRISFNAENGWFEFVFDYNDFTTKAEGTCTTWTLCTYGERIRTFRNPVKNHQWDDEHVVLTDEFKQLFEKYEIDILGNLKESISAQSDAHFFKELLGLMKLLLQMRNSITNSQEDYLLSPVADKKGHFFDSREGIESLPDNADANGAYNIARKGLWIIEQIKQSGDLSKLKLAISNKDWLRYAQGLA